MKLYRILIIIFGSFMLSSCDDPGKVSACEATVLSFKDVNNKKEFSKFIYHTRTSGVDIWADDKFNFTMNVSFINKVITDSREKIIARCIDGSALNMILPEDNLKNNETVKSYLHLISLKQSIDENRLNEKVEEIISSHKKYSAIYEGNKMIIYAGFAKHSFRGDMLIIKSELNK